MPTFFPRQNHKKNWDKEFHLIKRELEKNPSFDEFFEVVAGWILNKKKLISNLHEIFQTFVEVEKKRQNLYEVFDLQNWVQLPKMFDTYIWMR